MGIKSIYSTLIKMEELKMFEKFVGELTDFEEKLDDFVAEHQTLCAAAFCTGCTVLYIGIMGYYAKAARTNKQLIKALKKAMIID